MITENMENNYSDESLIAHLPGFVNKYAEVNGVKIHYVDGGFGIPLICLPGWPQTWYSYHKVAPALSEKYRVIIVDIRGMGSSEKPKTGYDKKTMAADIFAITEQLGLGKIYLLGHDIGGMVAMSFAFNYPKKVSKLILIDGAHPSEGIMHMPMLPAAGTFEDKMDANYPYAWWMGFNQVKHLPEKLLAGRFRYLLDYLFAYVMIDESYMTEFDREVYAAYYNDEESIRASNAWYQAFSQDIEDSKTYGKLEMPVLGIGSYESYNYIKMGLPYVADNCEVKGMLDCGHYIFEEKPEDVLTLITEYLK